MRGGLVDVDANTYPTPPEFKRCGGPCGRMRARTHFAKDRSPSHQGLQSWCIDCKVVYERIRRRLARQRRRANTVSL